MLAYANIRRRALSDSAQDRFCILGELYLLAQHLFSRETRLTPKEKLAESAYRYLQRELSRPTLLEDAAAHCSVSGVYLRKVFSEVYGKSPFAVLTQLRMTKARTMLLKKTPHQGSRLRGRLLGYLSVLARLQALFRLSAEQNGIKREVSKADLSFYSPNLSLMWRRIRRRKITDIKSDISSAIGNANHTSASLPVSERR